MPDFGDAPIFSADVNAFQADHSVSFNYTWDDGLQKWVPETAKTRVSDEQAHALLESINDTLAGSGGLGGGGGGSGGGGGAGVFRDLTFHKKIFFKDSLILESSKAPELRKRSFKERLYKVKPEKRSNDNFFVEESLKDNLENRVENFDEYSPFAIRAESHAGGENNWYSFFPINKKMGTTDMLTIFNEEKYPLEIKCQDGESILIEPGFKAKMSKSEAVQLFIKDEYSIDFFSITYSIERTYTPEEEYSLNDKPEQVMGSQTYARLHERSVASDGKFLYAKHLNKWKRIGEFEWEEIPNISANAFPISYFDPYTDESFLYLDTNDGIKKADLYDSEEQYPEELGRKVWCDSQHIYMKPKVSSGWRRYKI